MFNNCVIAFLVFIVTNKKIEVIFSQTVKVKIVIQLAWRERFTALRKYVKSVIPIEPERWTTT